MVTSRTWRSQILLLFAFGITFVRGASQRPYSRSTERICSNRLNGPGGVNQFCYNKKWHARCWAEQNAVCSYRTDEERLRACCEMSKIKPECMDMCSFKSNFDFRCNSNCWSGYKKLIACASNGKDNTKCCKKIKRLSNNKDAHCLQMCAGNAPKLSKAADSPTSLLKWQPCFQAFYAIMNCHQSSFPKEDNWDKNKKWEDEKVDPKIKKIVEKYGKCEEKRRKERKEERERKKQEEKEEKERVKEEQQRRGSNQGKQERLEDCCRAQRVKPGCMGLCRFEPQINLICKSECFDDLKRVTYCAANKQDNTDCCKRHEIFSNPKNEKCLPFCRGGAPLLSQMFASTASMLAYQPCTRGMTWMLQCHMVNYPKTDQWKARKNWRSETVPSRQKALMERYGKCQN